MEKTLFRRLKKKSSLASHIMRLNYILLLAVLLLGTSIVQAYCPPYFAKIDSIENSKDCLSIRATSGCGGEVEIINHCSGEFYFYDENGNLNENVILINNEEWNKNYQKYQQLEKETGKKYWGHHYLHQPEFDEYNECYKCPNGSDFCSYDEKIKQELIIDGIDVCDKDNLKSGTVVKYWTIKIFSKEDNQDIIIRGRTVYIEPINLEKILFYTSIFFFIISAILLFAKYGLKKKIHELIFIILITWGILLFFLHLVCRYSMG